MAEHTRTMIQGEKTEYLLTDEHIGGGAFGSVWKGYIKDDEKTPVAIKVIIPRPPITDKEKEIIRSEVRVMQKLSLFPNCFPEIVCMYDYIEEENVSYIIMELMTGGTLYDIDRKDQNAIRICLYDLAKGLVFMHQHGIIHRDIKPANVLINKDGIAKIADLGMSCSVLLESGILPCDDVSGTETYLDPRFYFTGIDALKTATFKSDIFSLGQTMYEVMTGKEPIQFARKSREEMGKLYEEARNTLSNLEYKDKLVISLVEKMLDPINGGNRPTAEDIVASLKAGTLVETKQVPRAPTTFNKPKLYVVALVFEQAKSAYEEEQEELEDMGIESDFSEHVKMAIRQVTDKGITIPPGTKEKVLVLWESLKKK